MFDFFYGDEAKQFAFYRVPQVLFTDEKFKQISCEAKLLYGFLLDRISLSVKNNWIDKNGLAFVYFKQETAQENLNIGKDKALKIFSELEKIGLIIRKKQGQGNPTRIYVMNFSRLAETKEVKDMILSLTSSKAQTSASKRKANTQTSEKPKSEKNKPKSRLLKNRSQDFEKTEVLTTEKSTYNHTEINHTEINNISPSIKKVNSVAEVTEERKSESVLNDGLKITPPHFEEQITHAKEQIDYDSLISQGKDKASLELVVSLMAEVFCHRADESVMPIGGMNISIGELAHRFETLNSNHIGYVLDALKKMSKSKKITNLRGYLCSCLYNAPFTMVVDLDSRANRKGASYDIEELEKFEALGDW